MLKEGATNKWAQLLYVKNPPLPTSKSNWYGDLLFRRSLPIENARLLEQAAAIAESSNRCAAEVLQVICTLRLAI